MTPEDLEQIFLKRWGVVESMVSIYSQYLKICKQNDEAIDDFRGEISLMGEIKGPLIFYWANFLY
jgi:hypothetical protein